MADICVEILTPWHEVVMDGELTCKPLVTTCYRLRNWQDFTGQDAADLMLPPNLVSIRVVADRAIVDAIRADSRFFVDGENPNVTPAMINWFAQCGIDLNLPDNDINRNLRAHLRGLPKKR